MKKWEKLFPIYTVRVSSMESMIDMDHQEARFRGNAHIFYGENELNDSPGL